MKANEARITMLETENTSLKEENANLKAQNSALKTEIADLQDAANSTREPRAADTAEPQVSLQRSTTDDSRSYLSESWSNPSSRLSPSQSSSREEIVKRKWLTRRARRRAEFRSGPCPNCSADHPLKVCPCPNTLDGRLYACFDCSTTDHTWFQCDGYTHDHHREFYLVFVARQGLCPVVHNVPLHEVWRRHFRKLTPETQQLTLQRPGPLTPQFVLRMLHVQDGGDDPEIDRQMSEERRLLPWDLSKVKLFYQEVRVEDTVLDPTTRRMSFEVFYEGTETEPDDSIEVTGAQPIRS